MSVREREATCIGWTAIGGGAIVIVGACLSWFSLFAGLQAYRGIDVLYGRLLATGGGVSVVAGVGLVLRRNVGLRWGIGLLGFLLLALAAWSLVQVQVIYHGLAVDPLLVPRRGPGAIVAVAGALLIFATLFLSDE